ncbi:MAG: NAD(P)H-dependent oxidoreductase [Flavobacteriales bacterium]|nr:NAD(P)H-dependent oxidoreductase [Flavobacteriales bacterium]
MKTILAISGSASTESSNKQLLETLRSEFADSYDIRVLDGLWLLPLFTPQAEQSGIPEQVQQLRQAVSDADAVIICTPEYLHNIPAVLKNALEWMTTSGELHEKPVLPITFTPALPRGEHAMRSLLQSLTAIKAKVVAELPLYRTEIAIENGKIVLNKSHRHLLSEALTLL